MVTKTEAAKVIGLSVAVAARKAGKTELNIRLVEEAVTDLFFHHMVWTGEGSMAVLEGSYLWEAAEARPATSEILRIARKHFTI